MTKTIHIGVAGAGALGSIVIRALIDGIPGYELVGVADTDQKGALQRIGRPNYTLGFFSFEQLAEKCDMVVEALPPKIVPDLATPVLIKGKTLVLISSAALLLYPQIRDQAASGGGRILVPSGALAGLDGVHALAQSAIDEAKIISTKPPQGFAGAPFILENKIDLNAIKSKTRLFEGNAYDAAKAFPANVNVAASLSLAGIGPAKTRVEVWADPDAPGNSHEITVRGGNSTITSKVVNIPDPANPKSSLLAGYSIVAALKKQTSFLTLA